MKGPLVLYAIHSVYMSLVFYPELEYNIDESGVTFGSPENEIIR